MELANYREIGNRIYLFVHTPGATKLSDGALVCIIVLSLKLPLKPREESGLRPYSGGSIPIQYRDLSACV